MTREGEPCLHGHEAFHTTLPSVAEGAGCPGGQVSLGGRDLQNSHQGWLAGVVRALRWSPVSSVWRVPHGQLQPWVAASWSPEWESGLAQQGHEGWDQAHSWPGLGWFGDN